MKKYLKLLILVLTILPVFYIYKFNSNKYLNYTSLGDGLSLGIDSYGNIDYGYSDYVKDYLKNNGLLKLYIKKFSSQEMSINDLKNKILIDEKMDYKNKKINIKNIISESDIITMSIGLNDLIYKMSILDTSSYSKIDKIVEDIYLDFNDLIKEIRKYYKEEIYLIGYYTSPKYSYKINYAIKKLNQMYMNNTEIVYISTDYYLNNNQKFLVNPNSYYPNSKGYQAISSKIIAKILKKLEIQQNI